MASNTTVLDHRYVLGRVIGRGGMADVHRATDRVLGRAVAVKLLRDLTASEDDRARFTTEARTLARLSHPGLVSVLDAGSSDQPYLVMELVEGPTLAEYVDDNPLEPSRVTAIGTELADALAYAHDAGVIHRDVKPGNVLLAADGRALLTDFGIARLIGDAARHTGSGVAVGSPAYLSPEQVRGEDVTVASDVYSLGLVLLEALTGQRAYPGPSTEAALARLTAPPRIPDHAPPALAGVVARMTSLDPAQRPSAAEVARSLRAAAEEPVSDEPPSAPPQAAEASEASETQVLASPSLLDDMAPGHSAPRATHRADRPPRWMSGRWPVWAAAVVVLLFVAGAFLLLAGGGPEGDELPPGVPAQYQEPLRDLHDAVNGDDR